MTALDRPILCLNAGSSSLKFAVYAGADGGGEDLVVTGAVEGIGLDRGRLWLRGPRDEPRGDRPGRFADHASAIGEVLSALDRSSPVAPDAVGHRLVHGGPDHAAPVRMDASLLASLRSLIPLAPLHLPAELAIVEAVAGRLPGLPQAVCFDTAFHRRMPDLARRLPLSRRFWDDGLRRYGFHGLSCEYVVERLGPAARGRVLIAHLGNGASLTAARDGQSVDTTMGFTPAGGVMMGTRTGDLDPGVLLHLLGQPGWDAARLERLVNREAGLLGVSGLTQDMKTLLAARDREPAAALAVALFCYQVRKQVGALAAALGGLDTLVFTGGIGERAAPVRHDVCRGLEHLGIQLDPARNEAHADTISAPGARCAVRVIPTNEHLMIARHTRAVIFPRIPAPPDAPPPRR
jgi:acetate kinase